MEKSKKMNVTATLIPGGRGLGQGGKQTVLYLWPGVWGSDDVRLSESQGASGDANGQPAIVQGEKKSGFLVKTITKRKTQACKEKRRAQESLISRSRVPPFVPSEMFGGVPRRGEGENVSFVVEVTIDEGGEKFRERGGRRE